MNNFKTLFNIGLRIIKIEHGARIEGQKYFHQGHQERRLRGGDIWAEARIVSVMSGEDCPRQVE